jgi:predicted nucleotidyltransferase
VVLVIRFNKLNIEEINAKLSMIKDIFVKYSDKIAAAYLFGSFHKKNTTPLSDLDIALLFYNNVSKEDMENVENKIFNDISSYLGTEEVDLINLNNSPLSIKYGVLKDKEFLHCGNKDFIVDFESNVILEYIDFKPYRDEMNRMFLDSI